MSIYVGIGGWDFDPWRGTFYPAGLAKAKQLDYAATKLTAIEINATYYKLQKPELYARWAKSVPDGFKFEGSNRLGLQIVRALATGELRGSIELRNRAGGGTEAVLVVPLGKR